MTKIQRNTPPCNYLLIKLIIIHWMQKIQHCAVSSVSHIQHLNTIFQKDQYYVNELFDEIIIGQCLN